MTTNRALTLAAALAAVLTATGCPGKNCNDATPPVSGVPTSCSAAAGTQVTVPIRVCPKCDQATPTCLVHAENAAGGRVTLEPVSEVCDPNSSCPIQGTCLTAPLNCTFTMPSGPVIVTVVTPENPMEFQVALTGSGGSCN